MEYNYIVQMIVILNAHVVLLTLQSTLTSINSSAPYNFVKWPGRYSGNLTSQMVEASLGQV